MHVPDYLTEVLIILATVVVMVSVFVRIGLGAILGYLIGGILIGPFAFAWVTETGVIATLGEFGVVFLMFIIGLELPLERIKVMRNTIFGLGLAQFVLTTLLIAGIAAFSGMDLIAATVIGSGLALSSTAVVITLLSDKGLLTSRFGRTAFAILLMQDLAVGPLLAVFSALGNQDGAVFATIIETLAKGALMVVVIIALGRYVLRWTFVTIGQNYHPEVFAALTLGILLGAATLTEVAGLSLGFGAFLAGMLLSETHYRHQVAAEIQPFRGLLLGLFFISVGMSIDLSFAAANYGLIAGLAVALITAKTVVLIGVSRFARLSWPQSLRVSLMMSQGGEFSFVILAVGVSGGLVPYEAAQLLLVVVGITMLLTPLLALVGETSTERLEKMSVQSVDDLAPSKSSLHGHVVIAGIGRVGRTIALRVKNAGLPYIAVDVDAHSIAQAVEDGIDAYFGDATRPDVLLAMGLPEANSLIVAVDSPVKAVQIVSLVHYTLPDLKIYARAWDGEHAADLERAGASVTIAELTPLAVQMADLVVGADQDERAPTSA